jgi:hypothetical protein
MSVKVEGRLCELQLAPADLSGNCWSGVEWVKSSFTLKFAKAMLSDLHYRTRTLIFTLQKCRAVWIRFQNTSPSVSCHFFFIGGKRLEKSISSLPFWKGPFFKFFDFHRLLWRVPRTQKACAPRVPRRSATENAHFSPLAMSLDGIRTYYHWNISSSSYILCHPSTRTTRKRAILRRSFSLPSHCLLPHLHIWQEIFRHLLAVKLNFLLRSLLAKRMMVSRCPSLYEGRRDCINLMKEKRERKLAASGEEAAAK